MQALQALPDPTHEDLESQFEEYIGLVATCLDDNLPFNPLFKSDLYAIDIEAGTTVLMVDLQKSHLLIFCEE